MPHRLAICLAFLATIANVASAEDKVVATFSIVAFDPATGDLGVAVASKFLAVGAVVPWAKAGVGAVATQARANVTYGPAGLAAMAAGESAIEVGKRLTGDDLLRAQRQMGLVGADGQAWAYTGAECYAWAGHKIGENFCVQGNLLAGEGVLQAMKTAFEGARDSGKGELAHWLMAALQAGDSAGGDRRGRQSAAILVVRDKGGYDRGNDRYIDFRVDDHENPVQELARILELRLR
jgi:uncharacterized Ntn-hydrolase superfamily protein